MDVAEKLEVIGESWMQEVTVSCSEMLPWRMGLTLLPLESRNTCTEDTACQSGAIREYER